MTDQKVVNNFDFQGTLLPKGLAAPSSANDAARKTYVDDGDTAAKSRTNHTGSQTAFTISDFDTQVRTSRLDQMAAPTGPVAMNSQRLTGVLDPTSAQDAATRAYVDAQLAGTTGGLVLKGTARGYVTTNINTSSPGATLDGLTAASTNIFILAGQSTGSQNGPWVFNGSSSAMTRPSNWDTSAEAVLGSFWVITEGTSADLLAVMTNDTTVTLGTTALTFVTRGTPTPVTGYTVTCPSTSAGGTWTVTHNLASKFVIAQVFRVASPYDLVDVYIGRDTTNTITVQPDIAFASGEYEVMVQKVA